MHGGITRRRFLTTAAGAAAGLAVGGPTLWVAPARAAVPPAGLHLGFGPDPRTTMNLSWSTREAVRKPLVDIGLDATYGKRVFADGNAAPDVTNHFHHASVARLEPGTTYHYRVTHDGGPAVTGTFTTAPATPEPFRFATFGDMGVGADAAAIVQRLNAEHPEFCFVAGDLCYADKSGGVDLLEPLPYDAAVWDQFLAQIGSSAGRTPWMSTVGNHEMERIDRDSEGGYRAYLARFRPPGNGPAPVTYSFRYGNVGFVALDGNDASYEIGRYRGYLGSAQDEWLDATLASLRADPTIDFIVVGFHNCMYCTNAVHGSDGGNRTRWEPLFDEHGVDVVVNGHNHSYERTHPLRAGTPVADGLAGAEIDSTRGTTYLTVGGAGQVEFPATTHPVSYVCMEGPLYGGTRVPEDASWSAVRFMRHSVAIVDVEPGERPAMHFRVVDKLADGADDLVDAFTLVRP